MLVSCSHQYNYYSYYSDEAEIDSGTIAVYFSSATFNKISEEPEITEHNEPFGFRVVFLTEDEPGEEIRINVLAVSPTNTQFTLYKLNELGVTKPTYGHREKQARASGYSGLIKNITNGHQPIEIDLEVIYKGKSQRVKFKLKPEYREEHRNNWFDGVMSV